MRVDDSNIRLSISRQSSDNKIIGHRKNKNEKKEEQKNNMRIDAKTLKKENEDTINKLIKQFKNIKEELKKQKDELKSAKITNFDRLTPEEQEKALKEKKEKIKAIDDKIAEAEKQIQNLELQKQPQKIQEEEEKLREKQKDIKDKQASYSNEEIKVDDSLVSLIEAYKNKDTISNLKKIKTSEKLESMFISEEAREGNFASKRLRQIGQSAQRIDMNINNAIRSMNKKAKLAAEINRIEAKNKQDNQEESNE